MAPERFSDRRRPAFCYQTLDALAVLREHFTGSKRATALAIYTSLTELANEAGGASARDGFAAPRRAIAEIAGVSVDTVDRYAREFEAIGLLAVEANNEGQVSLPNTWALTDPPAGGSRTRAAGVAAPVRHIRARSLPERKEEEQEYAAKAAPETAQDLVAHYVDQSRSYGSEPPRRLVGQTARLVGELLAEGIAVEKIRAGIDLNLERRLHPAALPSCVHEAAMGRPPPRRNGGLSAEEIMQAAIRLKEQGR